MANIETIKDKIRQAKIQLGDDFGDEEMMEEAIFKAGEKAGRREVVEWIEEGGWHLIKPSPSAESDLSEFGWNGITSGEWQAKLKEWGIVE